MAIDGFDDGYGDPSDYGMSQEDFNDASAIGQATYSGDSDQLAQAIANSTARARSDPRALSDPSRSNVIGMANYDPSFAASLDISRGLDPRGIAGFKDTVFAKTNTPNPLQQLDQTQVNRITDALKLSGASDTYKQVSSLRGDDLKNYAAGMDLKNLNLADFDKMDTQSLANVFSSLGMTDKNPYGISAQGTSTGTIGAISNLLGLDTTPDFSRKGTPTYMSPKDIAEKARAGLGFASSGRDPSEFGSLSGIANQFGRDVSAGSKQITDQLLNLADGAMSYLSNQGKAGNTVENIAAEQKRIEIADLEEARQKQGLNLDFKPIDFPDIQRTNVLDNSFMDSGASLATNPEGIANTTVGKEVASNLPVAPSISNAERSLISSNMSANNILELLKNLEKETDNVEIDAGPNKGKTLTKTEPSASFYDGSQYNDLAMQKLKNIGYNVEVPNLPPSPVSRPFPGTDQVALRRDVDGYTFANSFNRPLDASRTNPSSGSNLTADQLRAAEFSGFSLDPVTNKAIYDERDPVEFIEKTNLPLEQQGIIALNTDMDYGQTNSLDNLLRNTPRSVAERNFLLNEIRKEKERMDNAPRRYPDSGMAGLPGLY